MSKIMFDRNRRLDSKFESETLSGLEMLPDDYSIYYAPDIFMKIRKFDFDSIFNYKPDFQVKNTSGISLNLEIKAANSISLGNIIKLIKINKIITEKLNEEFIVIAWGRPWPKQDEINTSELGEIKIEYVENSRQITEVVFKYFPKI